MTPKERAEAFVKEWEGITPENWNWYQVKRLCENMEAAIVAAVEAEREACAKLADRIRARELKQYSGLNPYFTIAEEIRDRIQMRPATSNPDWRELDF